MAALTGDEVVAIKANQTFIDRVRATLLLKAEYWKESATPLRTDVNRRIQKRKRLARTILSTSWADSMASQVAQYWIAYYQTTTPVLDANGIPTYDEIFNNFDPTFDNFAGYVSGDENLTEIDW